MKRFFKGLFIVLSISLISVSMMGCGEKKNNTDDGNQLETETEGYDNTELFSDDTKIVFNVQNAYYIIFHHNGTDITGFEYTYDYGDVETAKALEGSIKATYELDETVEKVERNGSKLKIIFKESEYKDLTLESIKETYSYLEEVKKES